MAKEPKSAKKSFDAEGPRGQLKARTASGEYRVLTRLHEGYITRLDDKDLMLTIYTASASSENGLPVGVWTRNEPATIAAKFSDLAKSDDPDVRAIVQGIEDLLDAKEDERRAARTAKAAPQPAEA